MIISLKWNIIWWSLWQKAHLRLSLFSFCWQAKECENFTFPPFPQMKEDTHSSQKTIVVWLLRFAYFPFSAFFQPLALNSTEEAILIKLRDADRSAFVLDIKMMGRYKKFTRNVCAIYICKYVHYLLQKIADFISGEKLFVWWNGRKLFSLCTYIYAITCFSRLWFLCVCIHVGNSSLLDIHSSLLLSFILVWQSRIAIWRVWILS